MHDTIHCPVCGRTMLFVPQDTYDENYSQYRCDSCGVTADVTSGPPEDLSVEFSKGNYDMMALPYRDRPDIGYIINMCLGESLGMEDMIIHKEDYANPDIAVLTEAATKFFVSYLPFAERYSPEAVEAAFEEYRNERSL